MTGWHFRGPLAAALLALVGCQRPADMQYSPSAGAQQLSPALRAQIQKHLDKYCGTALQPKLLIDKRIAEQTLKRGQQVFNDRCASCHGVMGDGAGPAAEYLYPRPRDYRRGIFKFTSTPYGARPRRDDLVRTVREGAIGTSMPAFRLLPEEDLQAVVDYVMALSNRGELEFQLVNIAASEDEIDDAAVPGIARAIAARWHDAQDQRVLPVTHETKATAESIERGKQAFLSETAGCFKCHGPDGRGVDVPPANAAGFKDDWGHATRAADLSAGMFHGGRRPIDIYRRIYSGISGTPMPAFNLKLANEPETFWDLVHYVEYISAARRREVTAPKSVSAAGADAKR